MERPSLGKESSVYVQKKRVSQNAYNLIYDERPKRKVTSEKTDWRMKETIIRTNVDPS